MVISPLQLKRYFFTKISIEANTKHNDHVGNISASVTCADKNDDDREWLVTLKVILGEDDDSKDQAPYTGELEVVGFFSVSKKYPHDQVKTLIHANAPAVLYGAVREMVFNLTARGPSSHIYLPTVSFVDGTEAAKTLPVKKESLGKKRLPQKRKSVNISKK